MKRLSVLLFCVAIVSSCVDPAGLPLPPGLSEGGEQAARQATMLLKCVKTWQDVRDVADRFSFSRAVLDTPQFDVSLWSSAGAGAQYMQSLAKRVKTNSSLISSAINEVAKSMLAGTDSLEMLYAPTVDTTVALPDTALPQDTGYCRIRTLDPSLIGSNFTAGVDSFYFHFDLPDSNHLDTLKSRISRVRTATTTGLLRTDRQRWKFDTTAVGDFRFALREQWIDSASIVVYRHSAAIVNQIIIDTIATVQGTSSKTIRISRRDETNSWWNSLAASQIIAYVDSFAAGDSTVTLTISDAEDITDNIILDCNANQLQRVRTIQSTSHTISSKSETVTTVQRYNPVSGVDSLTSFRKTLVTNLSGTRDSVIMQLGHLGALDSVCSLSVIIKPAIPGRNGTDATVFGTRKKSTYTYRIRYNSSWTAITWLDMKRQDEMSTADSASTVVWNFVPAATAIFLPDAPLPRGTLTVRADNTFQHIFSKQRIFERIDTSVTRNPVGYVTAWVDKSGRDTMRVRINSDAITNISSYRFDKPEDFGRRGTISQSGNSQVVSDTLWTTDLARIFTAQVDSVFNGTATVSGIDTFTLTAAAESLVVDNTGLSTLFPARIVFNHAQSRFTTFFTHNGLNVYDTVGQYTGGYMVSSYRADQLNDSTWTPLYYCPSIIVAPKNSGSGSFYGVFNDVNAFSSISATLNIDLWNSNWLGGEYEFR